MLVERDVREALKVAESKEISMAMAEVFTVNTNIPEAWLPQEVIKEYKHSWDLDEIGGVYINRVQLGGEQFMMNQIPNDVADSLSQPYSLEFDEKLKGLRILFKDGEFVGYLIFEDIQDLI